MHKAGFVNIIGKPNVGKSTLINALMGEKLSIVTAKAQTTRHRILGILSTEDSQLIFSDTPGIIDDPKYMLHERMMNFVPPKSDELKGLVDSGNYPTPLNIEMHVGSKDWQSNPDSVKALGSKLGINYSVIPNEGHSLSKAYVGSVLDRWLK